MTVGLENFHAALTIDFTATQAELDDFLKEITKTMPFIDAIVNEKCEGENYTSIEFKDPDESPIYIALVDELLIVSIYENDIKDLIGKIKSPSKEKTLAANPKYLDVAENLKKYDMYAFMRLDQVYKQFIENEETSVLKFIDKKPGMKMFISTAAIKNDLHLDAFDSLFVGAVLTDEGADIKSGFSVKSKEGIAALFQHNKFIPEIPKYAFEELKSMSVSSYDYKSNILQLEKLFKKISPMGFMAMKTQFGDMYQVVKTNVVENVEPYFVQLSGFVDPKIATKESASRVFVLKVKNTDLVYEMMDKAKKRRQADDIKILDFLGQKVYMVPGINKKNTYAAVVNNLLVITWTNEDAMWKHIISQIINPGKDIASHKRISDMWDSMPNEEVSMSYQDVGQLILDAHHKINEYAKTTKTNKVPDVKDLNYSLISKFYQKKNFWFTHMKLIEYAPTK